MTWSRGDTGIQIFVYEHTMPRLLKSRISNYWMRLSRIWRILQIEEGVIHRSWRRRWISFSMTSLNRCHWFNMTVQPLVLVNCACGSTQSETGKYFEWIIIALIHQGQVVRKVDNTIHCINPFPVDNIIGLSNSYPLDSDLSSKWHYSTIKQPECGNIIIMMLGRMLSTICIIPHIPLSFI